nr:hypothetical protein [Tanacetum cinerariifolium]
MRIFDKLDKEYEQYVLEKKKLQIEKKNLLIQNECLITDCIAKDICSIVLASDRDRPLSEELRSNCVRENSKVIELEAEILKQQEMLAESDKRFFEINQLKEQLQRKDDTIRKLQTQITSMSMLNVEPTVGVKPATVASKPMSKSDNQNHSTVPAKREKVRRVEDHHRNLNKQNHVDSRLNVKCTGFILNSNIVCSACNESLGFANHDNCVVLRGLPKLKYDKDHLCPSCQLGKSKKSSHPLKTANTNTEIFNTLHIDLCGPMRIKSINKKKYILVIVDDYTRFGWVRFLRTKDETSEVIKKFIMTTQRALNATVRYVRTDNGTEFVNKTLIEFFESVGITHNTSVPRSLQQNDVVERRNRTLMEVARTMLIFAKAPLFLWAEVVATACYTLNRSLVHTLHEKTYYELLNGKKPELKYFRVFGSLCYPTNEYDDLGKLKAKADIDIFVRNAPTKKANTRLEPNTIAPVHNSVGPEISALQSGRTRSELVNDPTTPSVPPSVKQLEELF